MFRSCVKRIGKIFFQMRGVLSLLQISHMACFSTRVRVNFGKIGEWLIRLTVYEEILGSKPSFVADISYNYYVKVLKSVKCNGSTRHLGWCREVQILYILYGKYRTAGSSSDCESECRGFEPLYLP